MFHRTQKLERLRSIKIVNTLIEKAMCKVCLETEVPEGQRGANTTRSWFCHWVEISAPGEWIHFPCYSTVSFFSNNLLLSHREDPLLVGWWMGPTATGWWRQTGTLPPLSRSIPGCWHLGLPHGISWFLSPPIFFWGAFPLFDLTDACALERVSASLTWGLSLAFHLLASHLHPGGSSAEPEASLNTTIPSDLHPHLSRQSTQGKQVNQPLTEVICHRGCL